MPLKAEYYTQTLKQFQRRCILLVLLSIFGISTGWASAFDEDSGLEESMTFHVYDDVDLVSTLKLQYGVPRIVVKSVYPQLASDTDREGINNFNTLAIQLVQDEVSQFKNFVKENSNNQKQIPKKQIANNLYIDYNTSYLRSNQDHIISIRLSAKGEVPGATNSYHKYEVLNYNLDTSERIELSDLFTPNSNYLELLSRYTNAVLARRLQSKNLETTPTAENFAYWNITPNGLMFTFKDAEVAPAMYGMQTVFVPYSVLNEVLAEDSPIAACAAHKPSCKNSNLLTGGFIDEAATAMLNKKDKVFLSFNEAEVRSV